MNPINSIIIEGNLTRDPEYSQTPKGTPVCTLSLASNRSYRLQDEQKREVYFFSVEVWANLADVCNQYLAKGRGIRVIGRLKQDRWQGTDGGNREKVKIVAEHVEFMPRPKKKEGDDSEEGNADMNGNSDELDENADELSFSSDDTADEVDDEKVAAA